MAACVCVDVDRRWWIDCSPGSRVGNGQWATSIEGWACGCVFRRMSTTGRVLARRSEHYHRQEVTVRPAPVYPRYLPGDQQPIRGHPITKPVTCKFCRLPDDMPTFV